MNELQRADCFLNRSPLEVNRISLVAPTVAVRSANSPCPAPRPSRSQGRAIRILHFLNETAEINATASGKGIWGDDATYCQITIYNSTLICADELVWGC